eukprot:1193624-Prorocentrum_minimum.AAC.2
MVDFVATPLAHPPAMYAPWLSCKLFRNSTSFYGSSCANTGKGALNTAPETCQPFCVVINPTWNQPDTSDDRSNGPVSFDNLSTSSGAALRSAEDGGESQPPLNPSDPLGCIRFAHLGPPGGPPSNLPLQSSPLGGVLAVKRSLSHTTYASLHSLHAPTIEGRPNVTKCRRHRANGMRTITIWFSKAFSKAFQGLFSLPSLPGLVLMGQFKPPAQGVRGERTFPRRVACPPGPPPPVRTPPKWVFLVSPPGPRSSPRTPPASASPAPFHPREVDLHLLGGRQRHLATGARLLSTS